MQNWLNLALNYKSILFGLLLLSCRSKENRKVLNTEIFSNSNDSEYIISDYKRDLERFQIITVIQGECPPCIMELESWSNLMFEFKDFPVSFIFVIHARQFFNFEEITRKIGFDYPVIFDPDNLFMKSNFPENYNQYPTFLCKDFRIIATGNPVRDATTKSKFIALMKDK